MHIHLVKSPYEQPALIAERLVQAIPDLGNEADEKHRRGAVKDGLTLFLAALQRAGHPMRPSNLLPALKDERLMYQLANVSDDDGKLRNLLDGYSKPDSRGTARFDAGSFNATYGVVTDLLRWNLDRRDLNFPSEQAAA